METAFRDFTHAYTMEPHGSGCDDPSTARRAPSVTRPPAACAQHSCALQSRAVRRPARRRGGGEGGPGDGPRARARHRAHCTHAGPHPEQPRPHRPSHRAPAASRAPTPPRGWASPLCSCSRAGAVQGNYSSAREHYGRMYEVLAQAESREGEQGGGSAGGAKPRAGGETQRDAGGRQGTAAPGSSTAPRYRGAHAPYTASSPVAEPGRRREGGDGEGVRAPALHPSAREARDAGPRKVRVTKGIGESESDYGAEDEVSRQSRRSTVAAFGPRMLALSRAAARAEGTEEDEGEEEEEGRGGGARKAGADAGGEGGAKSISVLLLEQEKEEEKRIIERAWRPSCRNWLPHEGRTAPTQAPSDLASFRSVGGNAAGVGAKGDGRRPRR